MCEIKASNLVSVSGVARLLGIAGNTVRHYANTGKLKALILENGTRVFQRDDVERLKAIQFAKRKR